MDLFLEAVLIGLIFTDIVMLGASRMVRLIQLAGVQGALLSLTPLMLGSGHDTTVPVIVMCAVFFCTKAIIFPWVLGRTLRLVRVTRMVEPFVGFNLSIACGVGCILFGFWLRSCLPMPVGAFGGLLIPAAVTTILTGMLLIIGRRKALTQVVGYLVLENGIYLFGAPLAEQSATWLELSILLDLFVAVFIMGIGILQINRTFESIDVDRFCSLRD